MRYYSSTAVEMALTGSVNEIVTTLVVDTVLGLPAQTPFTLVLDVGLSSEEVVTVTGVSGTNLTVTRGVDGTSAVAHTIGALTRHMVTARDLREPQEHLAATANVHGVGATASVVGTDTAQTLTNKTVNFADNTILGVPQASVTDLVDDIAALELADTNHAAATAAHGATGSVVGTTNVQTLTNKTVDCANNTVTGIPQVSVTNLVNDIAAARSIRRLVVPAVVVGDQGPVSTVDSQVLTSGATQIQSPGGQVRLTLKMLASGTVKDDVFIFRVRDGSPTGYALTGVYVAITNTTRTSALHIDSVAISAGVARTLYVTVVRSSGTGTITVLPSTTLLVDEDPA